MAVCGKGIKIYNSGGEGGGGGAALIRGPLSLFLTNVSIARWPQIRPITYEAVEKMVGPSIISGIVGHRYF